MNIREQSENREREFLSSRAALSINSRGRLVKEEPCQVRTAFQRDRDRVIHSKAFRRLKHKTQVFIAPEGDHYRTRLTHTLEVTQIARTTARALCLNEDLTEAIALGHDLGHTPFGHSGEEVLNRLLAGGFRHNEQSLRVVHLLEQGKGLNLTWEVRDGILKHTGGEIPRTLEGQIVRIADRMAYINHDIDDALRAGILGLQDLPGEIECLGQTSSSRINTMVTDLIHNNLDRDQILLSPALERVMKTLRDFMFEKVYIGSAAKSEENKAQGIIERLYHFFLLHPQELPGSNGQISEDELPQRVCDYIAGMTDRYCIALYREYFVPQPWRRY